jgi:ribonuclease VapC
MIAVDASAVLAIFLEEPEAEAFRELLLLERGAISAVNYWEVLARAHRVYGPDGAARVQQVMGQLELKVASVEVTDADIAYEAFTKFGKGTGLGPLNLGDCFAYALAQREGDGLLFKGDDFPKTDVEVAI